MTELPINPDVLQHLRSFFSSFSPISEKAMEHLERHVSMVKVKKGETIIYPDTPNKNFFFIAQGVLAGYIQNGKKMVTTWINEENDIAGSIRNFGTDKPSEETVIALEDSILIVLPIEVINDLYEKFPETNKTGRLILTQNYIDAEERAFIARLNSAEERYRRFLAHKGNLVNRIPLKHIASYLNMNLETLSRIRGRK